MTGQRIPVTILTGFLGAGKTTLIRSLLSHANGRRIAVIVNEFGDIGFDGALIQDCGDDACRPDDVIELTNGCICCTVAEDFVPTLEKLLGRPEQFDAIVIETSGLALPQPLLKAFEWPAVRTRATIDGVVTVVDATALAEGRIPMDDHDAPADPARNGEGPSHDDPVEEVFEDQLACADLVILSKADLVEEGPLSEIEAHLTDALRPGVRILRSQGHDLAPQLLLGLFAAAEDDTASRAGHHADGEEHDHDDFDSLVVSLPPAASQQAVADAVRRALAQPGVLRVKGYAEIAGKPAPLAVQAVGTRVELAFARPGTQAKSGLVVIGLKGLDRAAIESALLSQ